MNVSKTLSSALAAAAIVGGVGLAYAQTASDPSTKPVDSSTPNAAAPAPDSPPVTTAPSTSSSMPSSDTSTTTTPSTELAPKADRN